MTTDDLLALLGPEHATISIHANGAILTVLPITFGRARLAVSYPQRGEPPDPMFFDNVW